MAIDSDLKNYLKAVRVEHDERIDQTYAKKSDIPTVPEYATVSLQPASADSLGGVKVPDWSNIDIDAAGQIRVTAGKGLTNDLSIQTGEGVSLDVGGYLNIATASADSLGGVKVKNGRDGLVIENGYLKLDKTVDPLDLDYIFLNPIDMVYILDNSNIGALSAFSSEDLIYIFSDEE